MRGNPIWSSFAAGELSPRFYARSDTRPWRNGVATLRNMIATSHGPAMRRPGFCYIGKTTATQAKIFGYEYQGDKGYFIGISDTPEIQIYNISDPRNPVLEQTLTSPWTAGVYTIQADLVPGQEKLYFAQELQPPQELTFDPGQAVGSQWSIQAITFQNAPSEWVAGSYPGAITFFEGRLWLGGTVNDPERLWASKPGEFTDFNLGNSDDDADALDFTISRRGKIQWLAPAQNLMVGTAKGEHIILSQGGAVTTTDNKIQQQSAYGSFDTAAQLIGNIVLYVSPDGRKLRDVGYRWEENNWLSRDITFLSEHISRDNEMRDVTWQQNPDNLIWAVTEAGNALGCTYERHHDVIGWHRHDTDGEFEAVQAIDIDGTSLLMGAFKRVNGEIYYELMDLPRSEHCQIYLDSHVEVPSPGLTVTVPHLANKTVSVTIDGATHPDITLDGSGQGTLQYTGDDVHVGLNYLSEMLTLPLDYTPEEQGTSQHMKKRWNKIFVRVLESGLPLINNLRPPDRSPATPMGTPEPIATQDIQVSDLGWDRFAQIHVSQNLPLPLTIAGIFGTAAQKQL